MATSLSQPDPRASLDSSLWREYRCTRDPGLREELLRQHSGLVVHAARRLAGNPDTIEDLVQEGYLGLLRAIDRYDPARGVAFTTFAYPAVMGAMKNYLRDRAGLIREPESMRALRVRVQDAATELAERGQAPTVERLATQVGAAQATVRKALSARPCFQPVIGDGSRGPDAEGAEPMNGGELSVPDEFASTLPDHLLVAEALDHLTPTERAIIEHFFYDELNQREIAHAIGRSCSNVSRSLKRALNKLKVLMTRAEAERADSSVDGQHRSPLIRPAIVDAETGLFCRAHFRRCLLRELGEDREPDHRLCLALVSLDPEPGNRSPRSLDRLSALVRQNIRAGDLAFRLRRWLLALLIDEPRPLVNAICSRVCELAHHRAQPLAVTVSIAEWPTDAGSPAELLLSAHGALGTEARLPVAAPGAAD